MLNLESLLHVFRADEGLLIAQQGLDDLLGQWEIDGSAEKVGYSERSMSGHQEAKFTTAAEPFEQPPVPWSELLTAIDDHHGGPAESGPPGPVLRQSALSVVQFDEHDLPARPFDGRNQGGHQG